MLVLFALFATPAHALQSAQSGPLLELGFGAGLAGGGFVGTAHLTAGWWFGRYDPDYAVGRFTALLLHQQVQLSPDGPHYLPLLELRRSLDLLVLAPHMLIAVGPVLTNPAGVALRVGGGLKFRRSRQFGFTGRLAGGVDVAGGTVSPAINLTVGAGWSRPVGSQKH